MDSEQVENSENWKSKVMLTGGILGVVAGLAAAYLLIQRAEREQAAPKLNAREGVKLGVLVFGLLREISLLGEGK